jgi:putative endonuclease
MIKQSQGFKAWHKGVWTEHVGAWYLRCKGYKIIKQRFKSPVGEIDIIAQKGKLLIFVEVKARATLEEAAYAIRASQKSRISRAASAFLKIYPPPELLRFDVLLIKPWALPHHIEGAWLQST